MIKTYNPLSDVRNESLELTKRLYRGISDVSRQLDERRGRAQTCDDLFVPAVEAQRVKLREYCERLMFADPTGYGLKAEEILWRKGYYDVVSTAKRMRKNNRWNPLEIAYMQSHLSSGVGHYHHLLFRLQTDLKVDLRGLTDFPLLVNDEGLPKGKSSSVKAQDVDSVKWAREAAHRCLVYLGDLSRYVLDLYPGWDTGLTVRYYLQALNMNPGTGMPHNQLGTLAGTSNFSIDAAYHYMRCLMCPHPFEGADGNLQRIFEKNNKWLEERYREAEGNETAPSTPSEHIHCLVARFLLLADVWFFDKSVLHINELCHQIVGDLVQCLKYSSPLPSDVELKADVGNPLTADESDEEMPEHLDDDIVFKIVIISLLCAEKLKARNAGQHSIAVAFILGILSKLVHQVVDRIHDSVFHRSLNAFPPLLSSQQNLPDATISIVELDRSEPTSSQGLKDPDALVFDEPTVPAGDEKRVELISEQGKKAKKVSKLRRRRRRRSTSSSEESELSSDDVSDDSENEEHLAFSTDDDDSAEDIPQIIESFDKKPIVLNVKNNQNVENDVNNRNDITCSMDNDFDNVSKCSTSPVGVSSPIAGGDARPGLALNPADVIELVTGDRVVGIVKILFDWLRGDAIVIKDCSIDSRDLLAEIITLLNLINVDSEVLKMESVGAKIFNLKDIDVVFRKVPLPEDIILKGISLSSLKKVHDTVDWEFLRHHSLHTKEEALIRVYKLVDFGRVLVSNADLGVTYNEQERQFVVSDELPVPKKFSRSKSPSAFAKNKADRNKMPFGSTSTEDAQACGGGRKGSLMKSMHALWLRGEVNALETKKRVKEPVFSPYLAVDVDALIHHTRLVKQLVGARKFIVLIPSVVMSALDDLKGEVPRAREINRWLGLQHEKVNRFVRVQGPNERLPIPLIKYPKKKDKEAWMFFQVVECCQYFNTKYGSNPNVPLVTLLSGQKNCSVLDANDEIIKGLSPVGVAKTAGINLESIEMFHAKWKSSSKSHG